jgi:uncharacterized repeat protein (TIGR02543 family)
VPKPTDPTRLGYTFNGWHSAATGGTAYNWPYTLNIGVTMHAQWTPHTYTVVYDPNSGTGTMAPSSHIYGLASALTANSFTRTGYAFGRWTTQADGSGTKCADGQNVTDLTAVNNGTVTLYAQWTAVITFDSHGGSAVAPMTVYEGEDATAPANPTRAGYTFKGWYNAATGGTAYTWPHAMVANVTMHAQWRATITFDSHGGSAVSSITQDEGTAVTTGPAAPTRVGYTFKGWYSAATGGTLYNWPYTLSTGVTMHAQWRAHTYTVEYNPNYGTGTTTPSSHTYDQDKALTANGFTRTDYTFGGWNTQASSDSAIYTDGQSVRNLSSTDGGVVTLYAQWKAVITFDSHGGSAVQPITAYERSTVTKPTDPTRAGYTFKGWYNAAGDTAYTWPHTMITGVTMHAQWRATITFDSHGGTTIPPITQDEGTAVPTKPTDPARLGYTFKDWYDAATGGTAYAWPYMLNIGVTMHAQWTAHTYTVTYDANGGDGGSTTSSTHTYDQDKALTANGFTRTDYSFGRWNTQTDGSGTNYTDGQSVTNLSSAPGGAVTLYAQWKAVITFDSHGGSAVEPITAYDGTAVPKPTDPTRLGYTFNGWHSAENGGTPYTSWPYTMGANVTMHAQWTANTYTVEYNSNGGDGGSTTSSTHTYDQAKVLTANSFTRTGYTFGGWNTQANGGGTSYTNSQSVTNLSSANGGTVYLYAKWTANTYTVTYNANGGDGGSTTSSPHTYDQTRALTANGFTRTGYVFAGWNTQANGSGTSYGNAYNVVNLSSVPDATVTLYAQWAHEQFTITLNLDAGAGAFSQVEFSVSKPSGSQTVTIDGSGYSNPRWEVDGEPRGTENSITVNAADYSLGKHRLTLIISKSGISWSKELSFTVTN